MDVLDERFCLCARLRCVCAFSHAFLCKKELQHLHQRTVTAHEVNGIPLVLIGMCKTQANQSLDPGTPVRKQIA